MLKLEADVETALAGLSRAGVVRVDCTRIIVDGDPVFHDVVQALYRREFGGMTPEVVAATLAAEKVRGVDCALRRRSGVGSGGRRCALHCVGFSAPGRGSRYARTSSMPRPFAIGAAMREKP